MYRGKTYYPRSNTDFYNNYYMKQVGTGIPVYQGGNQYGQGLGNVLGGLFRSALPFLKSGAKVLGKTALSTGADIVQDVLSGKNLKSTLKRRTKQAGRNLGTRAVSEVKSKMNQKGSGRRGTKRKSTPSAGNNKRRRRNNTNSIQRRVGRVRTLRQPDIFDY